jgi:hypothetical protein
MHQTMGLRKQQNPGEQVPWLILTNFQNLRHELRSPAAMILREEDETIECRAATYEL